MIDEYENMQNHKSEQVALFALFLGVIGIAWAPILFHLSELGPAATAFWRFALAFPFFCMWRLATARAADRLDGGVPHVVGQPTHASERSAFDGRPGLFLGGAFFAGDLVFWHWSLTLTTVANATLFANAAPIFVTLAGWLIFGRRFSGRFLLGLALAMAGAGLLMGGSFRIASENLFGDMLGIAAALFLAGYLLTVERLRGRYSTASIMVWNAGAGALLLFPLALFTEDALLPSGLSGWGALLALALVSHVAGQSLIAFSMSRLPAPFTAVSLLCQPVLAAVFAWMVLGETIGSLQFVGGAIILFGVLLARNGAR